MYYDNRRWTKRMLNKLSIKWKDDPFVSYCHFCNLYDLLISFNYSSFKPLPQNKKRESLLKRSEEIQVFLTEQANTCE